MNKSLDIILSEAACISSLEDYGNYLLKAGASREEMTDKVMTIASKALDEGEMDQSNISILSNWCNNAKVPTNEQLIKKEYRDLFLQNYIKAVVDANPNNAVIADITKLINISKEFDSCLTNLINKYGKDIQTMKKSFKQKFNIK